jgi:hypothetical protein
MGCSTEHSPNLLNFWVIWHGQIDRSWAFLPTAGRKKVGHSGKQPSCWSQESRQSAVGSNPWNCWSQESRPQWGAILGTAGRKKVGHSGEQSLELLVARKSTVGSGEQSLELLVARKSTVGSGEQSLELLVARESATVGSNPWNCWSQESRPQWGAILGTAGRKKDGHSGEQPNCWSQESRPQWGATQLAHLWRASGSCMESLWLMYGEPVAHVWRASGSGMESLRLMYGEPLAHLWRASGSFMESLSLIYGEPVAHVWRASGSFMESLWLIHGALQRARTGWLYGASTGLL